MNVIKLFKKIVAVNLIVAICISISSCKKYLEAKPDKKLVVPTKVADMQALLDYSNKVNYWGASEPESAADNYYLTKTDLEAITELRFRRMYTWEDNYLFDVYPNSWSRQYDVIYIANTVLDGLKEVTDQAENLVEFNNVKGQALYTRAQSYLQVASVWSLAYDPATASTDLGVPLRLNPDFNETTTRSSLGDTYEQIINDLKAAIPILPTKPIHVLRASKPAAYGLLARTYLYMRKYEEAGLYADSCLQLSNKLIDYNTLSPTASFPLSEFNEEVIYHMFVPVPSILSNRRAKIVPELYNDFDGNDLRKKVFFRSNADGTVGFKGNYTGSNGLFGGIATDEMYLIRAESAARAGNTSQAMTDLNGLLKTRWSNKVTYTPLVAGNTTVALEMVLKERRKELIYRCSRWMDVKRLNKEGANIAITRNINGETYLLQPNDLKFALPIPEDVIGRSGIVPNKR